MPLHITYDLQRIVLRFPPEVRVELIKALDELALCPGMGTALGPPGSPVEDIQACDIGDFYVMYEMTEEGNVNVLDVDDARG